ncbi:hypothetical protein ES708_30223 [subsurface metagenome]
MIKWTPDKIIAAILVVGCLVLIGLRIDSEVKAILSMAAAWLFGTSFLDYRNSKKK